MYKVVVVLFNAGDHVPVTPLVEVVGKAANADPVHIAGTAAKVGVVGVLTVIDKVVVVAHKPAVGVKVYKVVVVLSKAGDHVPVSPLVEVVGKAATAAPLHIGATAAKVGVVGVLTVIVKVVVVAH